MVAVNDAIASAVGFAKGVLDENRSGNLRLEEVELRENPPGWLITLSMPVINSFGHPSAQREYKMFLVDGETGAVLSMKIRELASVVA